MSLAEHDAPIPPDPDARPLVLFDLDGTLTDPSDGIIACHRWALEELDIAWNDDVDPQSLIGLPPEQSHALLGVPDEVIPETVAKYRERFAIAAWLDDTPYPGVPEMLAELVAAQWDVGVASMKLEAFAHRVLDQVGLTEVMTVISGMDIQRTRRTKKAVIEHALAELGSQPKGVVVVGDRHQDIEAARSLGLTSIGAGWGFGSIEELIAANAHAIAIEPADVISNLLGD